MACECYHQKQEQYSGTPRYGSSTFKQHDNKTSSSEKILFKTNSTRHYYISISVWKTLLTFCILLAANPLTKVKGLKVGEKIRLLCFPEEKPDLSGRRFEWLLNGTQLKGNERIQFRKGNTVLRMKDATDRDVGMYTCQEVLGNNRKLEIIVYKVEFGKIFKFHLIKSNWFLKVAKYKIHSFF